MGSRYEKAVAGDLPQGRWVRRKMFGAKEYANLQKRYRNILTRGGKELPEIPPKPKGKRGKMAKSDAHNLWERLKTYETAVLLFAREPHVPFTNNRLKGILAWQKSNRKYLDVFAASGMPMLTGGFQAIYRVWRIRESIPL